MHTEERVMEGNEQEKNLFEMRGFEDEGCGNDEELAFQRDSCSMVFTRCTGEEEERGDEDEEWKEIHEREYT